MMRNSHLIKCSIGKTLGKSSMQISIVKFNGFLDLRSIKDNKK